MSVVVRLLQDGDQALLGRAVPGVFDHAVDPELADAFLRDPRHHLVAAIADDRPVGFVSASTTGIPTSRASWTVVASPGSTPRHRSHAPRERHPVRRQPDGQLRPDGTRVGRGRRRGQLRASVRARRACGAGGGAAAALHRGRVRTRPRHGRAALRERLRALQADATCWCTAARTASRRPASASGSSSAIGRSG